jgi:hypothetical protein
MSGETIAIESKQCSKCKNIKPLLSFSPDKKMKLGRTSWCISCYADRQREFRKEHPEKVREYNQRTRLKNPETRKEWDRKWKVANLEQWKQRKKRHNEKKRATPQGMLDERMVTAVRLALKGNKKGRRWEDLVGYSVTELKVHIEKGFCPGMTWENRSDWHIDHIIPKSAFNYDKPEDIDFKRCWALKNLRPIWAVENMIKNAKLEKPFQPSLKLGVG